MRWGKVILAIQAIILLILGVILLKTSLDKNESEEVSLKIFNTDSYSNLKMSFYNSSFILFLVGSLELIIIWRLLT